MGNKVNFQVELGGAPLHGVRSCTIKQTIVGHHFFEIRCRAQEKENILKNLSGSNIGKEIKIELSAGGGKSNNKNLVKGIVTHVNFNKNEVDEFVFSGHSTTALLDSGPHAQSFLKKNLGEIVREVAGKHNVDIKVDPQYSKPIPYVVQYNESAFHFLSRLADLYGEWFYYSGSNLYFGKPEKGTIHDLFFGTDLMSFSIALTARPSNFKLLAYDHVGHQFPESTAGISQVSGMEELGKMMARHSNEIFSFEPTSLYEQAITEKSLLNHLSMRQKAGNAANYVLFDGASDNFRLNVGSMFNVNGKYFDSMKNSFKDTNYGEFRVLQLVHTISGSGDYINHFTAIPASLEYPPKNPNVKLPVCEIQPAEVVANDDPEKLGRVEVSFWWQKQRGEKTPWIRVATNSAGGTHGIYFVPEIGDQVLVGFEHNNPDKPYVLGSLFHGKAKPDKKVPDSRNNKKTIKTKSGNHISFNDESGKEEIKIENGKNSITLTLSDKGKISIVSEGGLLELKAKNIKLVADENIESSAGKNVKIAASQKAEISAGSDLALSATMKASVSGNELKAEGAVKSELGASASQTKLFGMNVKVEATAINDIKGAIIKLN